MWRFCSLVLLPLFGPLSHAAAAEPPAGAGLSADFLITDPDDSFGGTTAGRLHLDDSGMRVENKIDGEVAITIYDFARNIVIVLDTEAESYREAPWLDGDLGMMEWLFAREGGPCGDEGDEYVKTTKLGIETVNGRKVQKWRCAYQGGEGGGTAWTVWDDPSLLIFLRVAVDAGPVFSLSNLVVAPQPAWLFRAPAGYEKQSDLHAPAIE